MENTHAASVLVTTVPADVVQRLREVETWTRFLSDVGQITKIAHERYDFEITSHKHVRTARVAVRWHPQTASFVWTSLKGPSYEGSIRLADDGGWTRVHVAVTCWPEGFVANVADMVMSRNRSGINETALHQLLEDDPRATISGETRAGKAY